MSVGPVSARDSAELWIARGLLWGLRRWGSAAETCSPPAAQTYLFGKALPTDEAQNNPSPAVASHCALPPILPVPPIVWAYWSGPHMPPLIERCLANWRRLNPGMDIRVLNEQSAPYWAGEFPDALAGAGATLHADWLRLALLHRHGGIWLDASTVLTQPLDWVLAQQAASGADLVAYFLERYTRDALTPVVENWFLAAPPGSRFIADLYQEFTEQVLVRGGAGYVRWLERGCDREGERESDGHHKGQTKPDSDARYAQLLQGIDMPEYLSMHLAIQRLLRSGRPYRLSLRRAEEGPFFYHALGGWGRTALKTRLLMRRAATAPPPLIKLRKPDRKRLDLYLERGLYAPNSLVGQYLCPTGTLPLSHTP